jgi:hypothetical protein
MLLADIFSSAVFATNAAANIAASVPSDSSIEYTVSLGNLLTIASFLVFVTVYMVNSRGAAKILAARLETVDANMEDFKIELKKMGDILIGQAQQDGRMNLIEQHVTMIDQRIMQEGQRVDALSENLGAFKNMVLQDSLKRGS